MADRIWEGRSVRAVLSRMVDDETSRDILSVAARAPSGTNMQPWRVYVVKCQIKQRITDAILNSGIRAEKADWDEYREAMAIQNKSLIRITPTRWSPIARGGFPADVAARLNGR